MVSLSVVVCFAALAVATATNVQQCAGYNFPDLKENIQLSPCKRTPCKLKKNTDENITIQFTPTADLSDVKNKVTGEVFSIPLPFPGVDGASICDKLFTEDGSKTSCPVKAGTKYLYKDSFPILSIYPAIDVKVRWELQDPDNSVISCFEVPAKIIA